MSEFQVNWHKDSSATVLGRLTAKNGSGQWTKVPGEGHWLKQADFFTITLTVYDLDGDDPDMAVATVVIPLTTILNTPVTSKVLWSKDNTGYNFLHDVLASYFPTKGHRIELEYKGTLNDGTVFFGSYIGTVRG